MADNVIDGATLKKIGDIVRAKAVSFAPSSRVAAAIEVEMAEPTATGQRGIRVKVDMKKHNVPFARAMEYGSGIWARGMAMSPHQIGRGREIKIAPKNGQVLAFFWDKVNASTGHGPKFIGISKKTSKAIFNFVEHPGIAAANSGKGYMRPALAASKDEIETLAGDNAIKNLRLKIRAVFTRPGGKIK